MCIYIYDVYYDLYVYLLLFRNGAGTDWKLSFLRSQSEWRGKSEPFLPTLGYFSNQDLVTVLSHTVTPLPGPGASLLKLMRVQRENMGFLAWELLLLL